MANAANQIQSTGRKASAGVKQPTWRLSPWRVVGPWQALLIVSVCLVSLAMPLTVEARESSASSQEQTDEQSTAKDDAPAETQVSRLAMTALLGSLTIFVLAVFVGFEVITKVPPTLHTPLMSGANAISGISLVGAVLAAGYSGDHWRWVAAVGLIAVIMATINAVGGFMVTGRMLAMFKKK